MLPKDPWSLGYVGESCCTAKKSPIYASHQEFDEKYEKCLQYIQNMSLLSIITPVAQNFWCAQQKEFIKLALVLFYNVSIIQINNWFIVN